MLTVLLWREFWISNSLKNSASFVLESSFSELLDIPCREADLQSKHLFLAKSYSLKHKSFPLHCPPPAFHDSSHNWLHSVWCMVEMEHHTCVFPQLSLMSIKMKRKKKCSSQIENWNGLSAIWYSWCLEYEHHLHFNVSEIRICSSDSIWQIWHRKYKNGD